MELTALEIVNEVQRDLRLPQSVDFTSAHARLILSYANRVQRDTMAPFCNWLELKVYRTFQTAVGVSIYKLTKDELTALSYIGMNGKEFTRCKTDEIFRAAQSTINGVPESYRQRSYNPATGQIELQFTCPADAIYTVDYEGYAKPPVMEVEGDYPMLNPESIVIGTILIAKGKQGQDVELDLEMWRNNFSLLVADSNQGGDVDFL
jgi:hypothetical protein